MPKDWDRHKTEIQTLYILNALPLDSVRKQLLDKYGFNASVRAYKMKLDNWKMWKNNKSGKLRQGHDNSPQAQEKVPTSPVLSIDEDISTANPKGGKDMKEHTEISVDQFRAIWSRATYSEVMRNPNVSANQANFAGAYPIECLLENWEEDTKHMECALSLFKKGPAAMRTTSTGKTILDLIEAKVSAAMRPLLFKPLLEGDLAFMNIAPIGHPECQLTESSPPWARIWRAASKTGRWSKVRHHLGELKPFFPLPDGKLFLDCAFVVIAERFLRVHMNAIEVLRAHRSLDFMDMRNMRFHRREYVAIVHTHRKRFGAGAGNARWRLYERYVLEIKEIEHSFHISERLGRQSVSFHGFE